MAHFHTPLRCPDVVGREQMFVGGAPTVRRAAPLAWNVGRDGLRRPLIARAALAFWSTHDADLWVNQRLLVRFVLDVVPGVDKDTVRSVIDALGRGGILLRGKPAPRRTLYRVSSVYADPTAPGYAREVDDVLEDPLPWVSAHGQFFRIGRPSRRGPWMFPVAAFPHHFTKHLWMRAWLRCAGLGLFSQPERGIAAATEAARWAPVRLLWELWERRDRPGPVGEAGRRFESTRLWRELRRARSAQPPLPAGAPEAAVRILHEFCGHGHLSAFLGRPLLGLEKSLFAEEFVHLQLDRVLAQRLRQRPPSLRRGAYASDARLAFPVASDPLVGILEAHVRALDASVQETLTQHRRAFPVGPITARTATN